MTKLTTFFILATALQVSAKSYSQEKAGVNFENIGLSKALKEVEKKSGFHFVYSSPILADKSKVSFHSSDILVEELIAKLLKNTGLTFSIMGNNRVVIKQAIALTDIIVKGKLTDNKGNPIEGVSVKIVGKNIGTATDEKGAFSLTVSDNDQLQFSFVGYETQIINVNSRTEISVVMQESVSKLNEVVVVGYGTQKKVNLTGAITTVNMDNVISDRLVTSTAQALQGAAPGLQITTGSGQPGAPSSINIRGFTSINGGSPLVLVDNVPMNMDDVNPDDIATVVVLKDASASSIYGARAAFGVILITTKHGRRNQPVKFNYSVNLASTEPSTLPEKPTVSRFVQALNDFGTKSYWAGQDVPTWLDLLQQYQKDPSQFPSNGIATVNGIQYPLAQTDLYKSFMPGGFEQLHNLSFNGGSEKTNFRVSFGYTNQDGIMATKADAYKRYNVNAFLNTNLTSKLIASVNVLYNNSTQNTPQNFGQLFYNAITFGPYAPIGYGIAPDSTVLPYYTPNNILNLEPYTVTNTNNLRLFGKLEYDIFKGLKLNGEYTFSRIAADQTNVNEVNSYINPLNFTVGPLNTVSQYYRSTDGTNYSAINLYANYTTTIASAHHLSAVVGTNQEQSNESGFNVSRFGIISTSAPSINGSIGTINGGDNFSSFAVSGYFGRLNYDYKGRYLLEATGRYDGSSRFPSDSRYGFFPSFSAGWNIMEESFTKALKPTIQLLKLRASYGEIGNQVVLFPGTTTQNYYPYIPASTPANSQWINPATNILNVTVPAPPPC